MEKEEDEAERKRRERGRYQGSVSHKMYCSVVASTPGEVPALGSGLAHSPFFSKPHTQILPSYAGSSQVSEACPAFLEDLCSHLMPSVVPGILHGTMAAV